MTISYDILRVPLILGFDLSKDGSKVIYSSNESGVPQLYGIDISRSQDRIQLTSGEDPVINGKISPKADSLVYSRDKYGNELHHLFVKNLEDDSDLRITEDGYRTYDFDWDPQGDEVTRAIVSMDSCGLESVNLLTGECINLKENMPPIYEVKYSNDGTWIACSVVEGLKNQHIIVLRRDDPSDTITYNLGEESRERFPSWSLDDNRIAFQSDFDGVNKIVIQDFQGDERITLELEEDEEVYGSEPIWSPAGNKIYYIISKHSRTKAYRHPLGGKRSDPLPFPSGTVNSIKISSDGNKLVCLHSSMMTPPGIYIHEPGRKSVELLTSSEFGVDLSKLVDPESIWYESFDGRRIHGWYIPSASGPTPGPAIVYPHGGPTGQVFDEWMQGAFFQAYAKSGYSVLAPNFRGSTGYGVEFRDLNIGDLGGGDLEDVVAGAEWLRDKEEIDGSRIAIIGASYGGFMTLMALSKRAEEFAAGVSMLPVVDWLGMYDLSDSSFRKLMDRLHGGPPSERREIYWESSPINHITKIKSPVMIVAGTNDSRCPIEPIESLVDRLEEMDHPHEFVIEERAGHITDFVKSEKRTLTFSRVIKYLNRVLKKS